MAAIEAAIDHVEDPLERECLRLRYIDGDGYRLIPWGDVAIMIYGDDDEKSLHAIFRLPGKALQQDVYKRQGRRPIVGLVAVIFIHLELPSTRPGEGVHFKVSDATRPPEFGVGDCVFPGSHIDGLIIETDECI